MNDSSVLSLLLLNLLRDLCDFSTVAASLVIIGPPPTSLAPILEVYSGKNTLLSMKPHGAAPSDNIEGGTRDFEPFEVFA